MRRRTVTEVHPLPRRLALFNPEQWPGPHDSARMSAWSEARREWADSLGIVNELPGSDYSIPDEPWDPELI